MDPLTILAAANAAVALAEKLVPLVRAAGSRGEISAPDQQALLARIDQLRNTTGAAYSGPEWQV